MYTNPNQAVNDLFSQENRLVDSLFFSPLVKEKTMSFSFRKEKDEKKPQALQLDRFVQPGTVRWRLPKTASTLVLRTHVIRHTPPLLRTSHRDALMRRAPNSPEVHPHCRICAPRRKAFPPQITLHGGCSAVVTLQCGALHSVVT